MPIKCSVKGCGSYKGTRGINFFRFPKVGAETWLSVVDKPGKMFTIRIPLASLGKNKTR